VRQGDCTGARAPARSGGETCRSRPGVPVRGGGWCREETTSCSRSRFAFRVEPAIAAGRQMLPDELSGGSPGPWGSATPRDALRDVIGELSVVRRLSCRVRLRSGELGTAEVFRAWPDRSLHVVGASPLAGELRMLIEAGAEPGWQLHPVPGGRTPVPALAVPLHRLSGSSRFFNLLDRSGFSCVEEVAATPDECLLGLYNGGPKFLAAVRQVISDLSPHAAVGGTAAQDSRERGDPRLPVLAPVTLRALQIAAAWAVTEEDARTAADLGVLAARAGQLPPDVAAAWDHIRHLDLRLIAGPLLPGTSLAALAAELLAGVGHRRQLIITTRTFALPPRRTYDTLAAELGISRERVRQLETNALARLAQAAAGDRYAPLRWRAASPSRPGAAPPAAASDAPPWMQQLLSWLSQHIS
jgi:hypothetical protein